MKNFTSVKSLSIRWRHRNDLGGAEGAEQTKEDSRHASERWKWLLRDEGRNRAKIGRMVRRRSRIRETSGREWFGQPKSALQYDSQWFSRRNRLKRRCIQISVESRKSKARSKVAHLVDARAASRTLGRRSYSRSRTLVN